MPADTKTETKPETVEPAKEAAPVAQAAEPAPPAPGFVRCRITKFGHDKIYTGETKRNSQGGYDSVPTEDDEGRSIGVDLFPRYPVNAIIDLPIRVAQKQEVMGNLEIQDELMSMRPLFTSSAGVTHMWERGDGVNLVHSFQNTDAMLDRNRAMARHNNGYTPSKDIRRIGSIPAIVRLKWLVEEGWDCFSPDPGCQKKLFQKLDSSEYAHLRTAEWRLGVLRGSGAA